MYALRSSSGEILAEVENSLAYQMMDNIPGTIKQKTFVGSNGYYTKQCYVFSCNGNMRMGDLRLYYRENDYLSNS